MTTTSHSIAAGSSGACGLLLIRPSPSTVASNSACSTQYQPRQRGELGPTTVPLLSAIHFAHSWSSPPPFRCDRASVQGIRETLWAAGNLRGNLDAANQVPRATG